jgi:hypothetical protein
MLNFIKNLFRSKDHQPIKIGNNFNHEKGEVRYNESNDSLEYFDGNIWVGANDSSGVSKSIYNATEINRTDEIIDNIDTSFYYHSHRIELDKIDRLPNYGKDLYSEIEILSAFAEKLGLLKAKDYLNGTV